MGSQQGRIHGKTVADSLAGAVILLNLRKSVTLTKQGVESRVRNLKYQVVKVIMQMVGIQPRSLEATLLV